ncbi:uncharacterized protein LOC110987608 [Acanthaster planci]|uniref:Uncharacterized protein LOC110987608 n=1 Tax=Acanthaster planci TaxID=133434 RepID=A0A8B7ZM73_ACAPL|nr:uncharacterized protein LOC110987608 [Acanthaster planci]
MPEPARSPSSDNSTSVELCDLRNPGNVSITNCTLRRILPINLTWTKEWTRPQSLKITSSDRDPTGMTTAGIQEHMRTEATSADMRVQVSMTTASDKGHNTTTKTIITKGGGGVTHKGVTMVETSQVVSTTATLTGEPGMGTDIHPTRGGDVTMTESEGTHGDLTRPDTPFHMPLQKTNGHNVLH